MCYLEEDDKFNSLTFSHASHWKVIINFQLFRKQTFPPDKTCQFYRTSVSKDYYSKNTCDSPLSSQHSRVSNWASVGLSLKWVILYLFKSNILSYVTWLTSNLNYSGLSHPYLVLSCTRLRLQVFKTRVSSQAQDRPWTHRPLIFCWYRLSCFSN